VFLDLNWFGVHRVDVLTRNVKSHQQTCYQ